MKKIIFLAFLLPTILFTNCKKNSNDPTPVTNNNPSFGTASAIASNGDTIRFTTSDNTSGNSYIVTGTATSSEELTVEFYYGQPANNLVVDVAKTSILDLTYTTSTGTLTASKGTVNVIVESSSIKIKFTDVTFTDNSTGSKTKYSGQLIIPVDDNTTGGGSATGSITIGGNTASLLVTVSDDGNTYGMSGYTPTYDLLSAHFSTKPTSTITEDLSEAATNNIYLSYSQYNTSSIYLSKSGSATTTVDGTSITVTFTDAVFEDSDGNTKTISGTFNSSPE